MKRIVSIAAAVFAAIGIVILGMAKTAEIEQINNESRQTEPNLNVNVETDEPSVWDKIRDINKSGDESTVEESDEANKDAPETAVETAVTDAPEYIIKTLPPETTIPETETEPEEETEIKQTQPIETNFYVVIG